MLRILLVGVALCASDDKDKIKDEYDDQAKRYCETFYESRNGTSDNIESKYIANGAQSVIYKCATTDDIEPEQAALKIYFSSDDKNFTEMEMIDLQLTKQDIRYPVYEWIKSVGKFEEFLSGYRKLKNGWKDGQATYNDFNNDDIRAKIAKEIAALHSAKVEGIDQLRYRSTDYDRIWWNTYEVEKHFGKPNISFGEMTIFDHSPKINIFSKLSIHQISRIFRTTGLSC